MPNQDPFVKTVQEWIDVFMRRSMQNFIRYTRACGLSMSQIGALFHIHHQGSSGVSDLGEHLGVSSAASSQMLERLVQQELIQRTEDPRDRRVKQIVLTEKGRQLLQAGINARQSWLGQVAENLSASDKELVTAALQILIDQARNIQESNDQNI